MDKREKIIKSVDRKERKERLDRRFTTPGSPRNSLTTSRCMRGCLGMRHLGVT